MDSLLDRIASFLTNPKFKRTPTQSPSLAKQVQSRVRQGVTAKSIGTPTGNQLFKTVSQSRPVKAVVSHIAKQPLFQLPNTTPLSYGFDRSKSPTIGDYVQGQIINPFYKGQEELKKAGALAKAGGAGQTAGAVFSATPPGIAYNLATGLISGAGRTARTGEDLNESVKRATTEPTSLAGEGLGVENPVLAATIDIVSSGPKGLVSGVSKLRTLKGAGKAGKNVDDLLKQGEALGIKGVNPRSFKMHPEDASDLEAARDILKSKQGDVAGAQQTVQNILDAYLPGYRFADTRRANQATDWLLDVYYKVPEGERANLPKLGLVGDQPSAGAPRKVEQTLRTDKFNVTPEQEQTLLNLQQRLGLDTRAVRSFDDMQEVAEALGTDPQKLLREVQSGRITDSEVIALTNVISQSSRRIAGLTAQLKQAPGDAKLLSQIEAEERLINQALRKRIKGGTEAGRSVAAFRQVANQTMEPAYWLDKAARQIGTDKELPADVVSAINDYVTKNDQLGLAMFVSKLGESSKWEKAITLWKAGLLTGFKTTIANVGSNALFAGLETAKDIPAAAFDIVRAGVTRSPRAKSFGARNITAQPRGFVEGTKRFVKLMKGEGDLDELAKAEIRRPIRFGKTRLGRAAQRYTETVFGIVGGTDKPFYQAAFKRSLADQARVIGINDKLDAQAVRKLVENPTEEMLAIATKDGAYATFTNANAANDAIRAAKRAGGPKIAAALDIVAPFTRTPTNVAKAAFFDYTPVGLYASVVNKIFDRKSVTNRELADAFGRSATGTALLWLGTELGRRGLVTGPSPSSESERAQWELEGKRPNSVFINGQWHSVTRISPLGNLILLGAAAHNSDYNVGETAAAGLKGFSETSFLRGVSSGLQGINQPDRFGSAFLENTVSGSVPTLASDIARGLDDTQRDPEGLRERAQVRVPIAREEIPSKLTSLGEDLPQQGGLVGNLINPFASNTPTDDPLVQELSRVGYNLNYVGDTIGGQGLSREQEREYQRLAGRYIREVVEPIIPTPYYQSLSTEQQHDVIEKAVNQAKAQARDELKAKLPEIESMAGQAQAAEEFTPAAPAKPLDLSKFSQKRSGIAGLELERERHSTARSIIAEPGYTAEQKQGYLKELRITEEDAEYDYYATRENAVKVGVLTEQLQGKSRDAVLDALATGREESISGKVLVTDAVLRELHDAGVIDEEQYDDLREAADTAKKTKKKGTGSGKGGTAKQRAALTALFRELASSAGDLPRPGALSKRPSVKVETRTLGSLPSRTLGTTKSLGSNSNAARVLSRADVDALLRQYAGR